MPIRKPVAAGRFYSGTNRDLSAEVAHYLANGKIIAQKPAHVQNPWAIMMPHAGYIYSGSVMGAALANQQLADRLIILCPNHTGRGKMLSVWPEGEWQTPLGNVRIDAALAAEIIDVGLFEADTQAHLGEHSIEVLLPFLQSVKPDFSFVPICVGVKNPQILARAGEILAGVLKKPANANVGLVVSSDMNHYESEKRTMVKDGLALEKALAADPAGLLQVTEEEGISMCGAAPLALALYTANDLGRAEVEIVAHDTSGRTSGDYEHVVGYAALRIYL